MTNPAANIHVVRDNEESKNPDKKKKKEPWKWTKEAKAMCTSSRNTSRVERKKCALIPETQAELKEIVSPMEIFELVAGLEELIDLNVVQTNLYAQQKGRNFIVDSNELKAFRG